MWVVPLPPPLLSLPPVLLKGCGASRLLFLCGWCCSFLFWVVVPLLFFFFSFFSFFFLKKLKYNEKHFLNFTEMNCISVNFSLVPQSSFCVVLLSPLSPFERCFRPVRTSLHWCGAAWLSWLVLPSPPSFWVVLLQWCKFRVLIMHFYPKSVWGIIIFEKASVVRP